MATESSAEAVGVQMERLPITEREAAASVSKVFFIAWRIWGGPSLPGKAACVNIALIDEVERGRAMKSELSSLTEVFVCQSVVVEVGTGVPAATFPAFLSFLNSFLAFSS